MSNIVLKKDERIDDLQYKNLKLVQNREKYCFSTDAVLLANFVKASKNSKLVDLCTGSGVVATLALMKNNLTKVYGIELQEYLFDLAVKSAKLNNLEGKLHFIHAPIQKATQFFEKGSIDVVTVNPPYEVEEGHYLGKDAEINICKYETHLTLEDVVKSASDLLKFGGKFYMVHKATRLSEIMVALNKYKLEPKVVQFVQPKEILNANVVLIEALKNGKKGLVIKPNIIINNEDGTYTEAFQKIYEED